MQEVSRVHSIPVKTGRRDEPSKLDPNYIVGFVDGEGCFCVSISKSKTAKRRIEVRPEFEIELRADDLPILERIQHTLGCGRIYHLNYERYGWSPHVKYKVSSNKELKDKIVPFFEEHPLQAVKAKNFKIFAKVVIMVSKKQHLDYGGFEKILKLRDKMRQTNKKAKKLGTARIRENRSSSGVRI